MQTALKLLFNSFSALSPSGQTPTSTFPLDIAPFSSESLCVVMNSLDYGPPPQLIRYRIRQGRLSIHSFRDIRLNERTLASTQALHRLCRTYRMSDCDFILTLHDAFTYVTSTPPVAPVFSFAKDCLKDENVLLFPDFEILRGYKPFYKETHILPWSQKKPLAIWRGGTTGGEYTLDNLHSFPRVRLIQFSKKFPELLDACFNTHCLDSSLAEELGHLGLMGNTLSVEQQLEYKYQILIDGNSCAYSRAYWQLFSNALMFKIDSNNVQWYYKDLRPYIHYVPVKEDLSDLGDQIEWAKEHDEEAQAIVRRANVFAKEHLTQKAVYSYLGSLLTAYSNQIVR
jgi:hypothetical protein